MARRTMAATALILPLFPAACAAPALTHDPRPPTADGGAAIGRQPPAPFRLVELSEGRAVFENPARDDPQRTTGLRSGGALHMRVEDLAATRATGWFLARADLP